MVPKFILLHEHQNKLEAARDELNLKYPGSADIYSADITKEGDVEKIIDQVYVKNGKLNIFVNNAGAYHPVTYNSDWKDIEKIDNVGSNSTSKNYTLSFKKIPRQIPKSFKKF